MINKDLSVFKIDRRSTVPFDTQLRDNISGLIFSHRLVHNQTLPSIESLAISLDVNRSIVEDAYQSLVEERLVILNGNEAPTVSYFELVTSIATKHGSIYEALEQMGFKASITCLSRKKVVLESGEAKRLGLPSGRPILKMERVYYGDETPFAYLIQYFPLDLIPQLETQLKDDERSFLAIAKFHPNKINSFERTITAVKLTKEQISILKERKKAAGLFTLTKTIDSQGSAVETSEAYIISRYFFKIDFNRSDLYK